MSGSTHPSAECAIGALFLLSSLTIARQPPAARTVQGRRRSRAIAPMAMLFAVTWLLVAAAGRLPALSRSGRS